MTTLSLADIALDNGQWVRRGMVWIWVENPPAPEPVRAKQPHDLIACPACGARMDEHCKTRDRSSHGRRLVKRVCSCGGPVRPREPMCGFCRAEMSIREAA